MKKCALLLIVIFSCVSLSSAQVLKINQMQWTEDYSSREFVKEIQHGDEIEMETEDLVTIFDSDVVNLSDVVRTVSLTLEVFNHTDGIDISACWKDCLEPWNFNFRAAEIDAGATELFSIDYMPKGIQNSKAWVTCTFSVEGYDDFVFHVKFGDAVSVNDPVITKNQAYPNPVSSVVNIDYALNKSYGNAQISLYNILGIIVYEQMLNSQEGTATINVSNFPQGIYFYVIKVDGKDVETKKLIISR